MTAPIPIIFGAWKPDQATFQSDALTDALNVVPVPGGYGPTHGFNLVDGVTITPPILGATVFSDTSDASFIYAGSGDDIYVSNNGAVFSSKYHNATPLSTLNSWQFARFVGKAIAVQLGAQTVAGDIGQTMTALAGSPPRAKTIGVVGDFLVLGDLDDGIDGHRPNRIRWCGFRDPTTWGTSVGAQSDYNDMPDEGGAVQGIVGREFGSVFQRYSISRMTYVGPDTVFRFDVVEKKRGAISSRSIIDCGLIAAYIADDGFMLWDGTNSTPIGAGAVNEYFRGRLAPGTEDYIVGAFDPLSVTISWAYRTDGSALLKERLSYSLTENRWTRSDLTMSWLTSGFDIGYTLESLDQFGSLDNLPFSLDDPKLQGKRFRAVGFDASGNYGPLNGDALAARLDTGDFESAPGIRSFVNGVRPIVDAPTASCAIGWRPQAMSDPITFTNSSPKALDGNCPLRAAGRYMRFRTNIDGMQSWTRATGLEVPVLAEGMR